MQATTTLYFQFHFLPAIYFHLYLYITFKTGEAPPEASLPVYTKSLCELPEILQLKLL